MSLRAYGRRRGVSGEAVSKAVDDGRLVRSVVVVRGQPKIADPDLADREWEANTRQRAEPLPAASEPASNARAGGSRWSRAFLPPPPPESSEPADAPAPLQSEGYAARTPLADIPDLNTSRQIREAALARRDTAHADQAELELAARRGRLVDAEAARADVEQAYSLVKTRLLRVPSAVAQQLPDLAARVVPVLDVLITEALEELALPEAGGRSSA